MTTTTNNSIDKLQRARMATKQEAPQTGIPIRRASMATKQEAAPQTPGIPIRGASMNTANEDLQYMSHYCVQARQRNEELAKQLENALLEKQTMEGLMSKYLAELRSEQCLRMQLQMQMAAAHQLHNKAELLEAQLQEKDKLVLSLGDQVSELRARAVEEAEMHEAELAASKEFNARLQRDMVVAASKESKDAKLNASRDMAATRQQQQHSREFECTHCMKMGHTKDKCWDLHPELKPYCNQCRRSGHPTYKCHFLPPTTDDSPVRKQRRCF